MVSMVMLNLGGETYENNILTHNQEDISCRYFILGPNYVNQLGFPEKCNCDLGPRPRSPDGRSNPPKTGIELSKYVTYAPVVMFDTTYVRLLLIWIFSFILILSIDASELG